MTRLLVIGAPRAVEGGTEVDTGTMLARSGGNTGNILIGWSLLEQLEHEVASYDISLSAARIDEEFDLIVIPAANFIYEGFDFGFAADAIERTKLPCLMVGLGAQAKDYSGALAIPVGTRRFLEVVSERSARIGVRGNFTAGVLERIGITNVQVTGCPSFYLGRTPRLKIAHRALPDGFRLAIHGSRNVVRHSFDPGRMAHLERQLVAEGMRYGADFVAQNEVEEIILARGIAAEITPQIQAPLRAFYKGIAADEAIESYFAAHSRVFFDVPDWAAAIRGYDFVIGSRFHGSMMALQHGVPAFMFAHDTRTEEMCRLFSVPHVNIAKAGKVDVRKIYETMNLVPLLNGYPRLYRDYVAFLEANGVRHRMAPSASTAGAASVRPAA